MKNLIRIFIPVFLTLGLFLAWVHPANAAELRGKKISKPLSKRGHVARFLKKLNLTDSQRDQIRQLRATYRKKAAEISGQLKVKEIERESEMEKTQPDRKKLDLLTQEIGELKKQRESENIKARLELEKKILTAEQVEQLKAGQNNIRSESDDEIDAQP